MAIKQNYAQFRIIDVEAERKILRIIVALILLVPETQLVLGLLISAIYSMS